MFMQGRGLVFVVGNIYQVQGNKPTLSGKQRTDRTSIYSFIAHR